VLSSTDTQPGKRALYYKCLDRDYMLENIVLRMPSENYEKIFDTVVAWGRYGNLFAYDEDARELSSQ
jgi:NitT/TauT family transport system ATP-binding protein